MYLAAIVLMLVLPVASVLVEGLALGSTRAGWR